MSPLRTRGGDQNTAPSVAAQGSPTKKWGYHELHFKDAFQRYLGKGLPSEAPPERDRDEKEQYV